LRIRILIGILVLAVGALVVRMLFFSGPSDTGGGDETRRRIARLAEAKDIEALSEQAGGGDDHAATLAVSALGGLGPPALPALDKALADRRPAVREKAATSFSRIAPRGQAGKLASMSQSDPSPNARAAAVAGMDRMFAFQEMDAIIEAMEDSDPAVRRRASRLATKFAGVTVQYDPDASPAECRQGARRMRQYWQENKPQIIPFLTSYYKSTYEAAGRE